MNNVSPPLESVLILLLLLAGALLALAGLLGLAFPL